MLSYQCVSQVAYEPGEEAHIRVGALKEVLEDLDLKQCVSDYNSKHPDAQLRTRGRTGRRTRCRRHRRMRRRWQPLAPLLPP